MELYRPTAKRDKGVADTGGLPADNASPQEQSIIRHLALNPTITVKVAGSLLAVKDSRAREILKRMTDKGLLVKQGRGRSTYYGRPGQTVTLLDLADGLEDSKILSGALMEIQEKLRREWD